MVFINGVNIGRYWSAGPQRTLYVPVPILKSGLNRVWGRRGRRGVQGVSHAHGLLWQVIIFEMLQFKRPQNVVFVSTPILDKPTIFG